MTQREQKPDLASAMWPHFSREAKAKEAQQAKAQAEQKARLRRTIENLDEIIDAVRKERGQQSNK